MGNDWLQNRGEIPVKKCLNLWLKKVFFRKFIIVFRKKEKKSYKPKFEGVFP